MRKYLVEFIGTFFLVIVIGFTTNDPQIWAGNGTPFAPIAIGSALMCLVYMGGPISGAHYNPAVTLAIWIRKRIDTKDVLPYMASQILGAMCAALVFYFSLKRSMGGPAPLEGFNYHFKPMLLEALFTFMLALVVLNVATSKKSEGNSYYGLAIGFTVMVGAFCVGKITGGAFNPAVGLGPNLIHSMVEDGAIGFTWIYIAGPFIGGALAAIVYKATNPDEDYN
ncbi:MAG TPA: aquaporin [Bacteroidia bacterium]|nr:aquaporin [Bacteroidia bacterium]HNT80802.1 aquaporin [Bacteroidia bacterium]